MSTTATLTRPTSACPATPCPQTVVSSAPTGNWQHPHFDEIHRRLNENVFGERNVRSLLWNSIFLIVTFFVTKTLSSQYVSPKLLLNLARLQILTSITVPFSTTLLRPLTHISIMPL